MSGSLPSEGVYEDIGAATAGEKDEAAGAAAAAVLEEEYDDVAEPEPEEGVAEEGALLGPTGAQLCVVASTVLLLLYWRYAQGSAPPSPYI